ncbi:hypothetical protein [Mesorhizobium temperatum]|uniref:Uncharacterized protein n=1 Tax=Mesorhizobium temperatum TaxID=241416 RepID=A0A271LQZ0_9HYPH|nr:hypothetical protein [Mesorhizobium temperatum]PAQ09730.1 hypothetical protein CIT26_11865 [Mesorhizobium temperatum]
MGDRQKLVARSASEKTEDWPFWFIADEAGRNVLTDGRGYGGKFDTRGECERRERDASNGAAK